MIPNLSWTKYIKLNLNVVNLALIIRTDDIISVKDCRTHREIKVQEGDKIVEYQVTDSADEIFQYLTTKAMNDEEIEREKNKSLNS